MDTPDGWTHADWANRMAYMANICINPKRAEQLKRYAEQAWTRHQNNEIARSASAPSWNTFVVALKDGRAQRAINARHTLDASGPL